jgi:DNA-binding response OmpR family regulator
LASAGEGLAGAFTPEGRTGLPESAYAEGMHVVVVDDEPRMVELVCRYLDDQQVSTDGRFDGPTGLEAARQPGVDAVVLDLMLPGLSGVDVCTRLRAEGNDVPVLMLTARGAVAERVAGLEAGADDYLVKPFAMEELVARLRALGRRGRDDSRRLAFADLTLDLGTRVAERGGRPVELTGRESALLELLLRHARTVVPREQAIAQIWDEAAVPNVVDRYVTRLRRKLGDPPLIHTVRGVGFILRA